MFVRVVYDIYLNCYCVYVDEHLAYFTSDEREARDVAKSIEKFVRFLMTIDRERRMKILNAIRRAVDSNVIIW